jgi:hypothetical protein
MTKQAKRLSRRTFLLAATAGSAATAAAIVGTQAARPQQPSTPNDKRSTRGYQASAHVHNYYRSTKV